MYLFIYILISIILGYVDYKEEKCKNSEASLWNNITTSFIGVGLIMGGGYLLKYFFNV